jgi:hypothetical protein
MFATQSRLGRGGFILVIAVVLSIGTSHRALAQGNAGVNQGSITTSGGIDFLNAYMFRGLRQEDAGVVMWPWADIGISLASGSGGVDGVSLNFGTWNSLHTGPTGAGSANGKVWYESDFYGTLGLAFNGMSVGTTYTAYTSPNNSFTTVKELAFKVSATDVGVSGFALAPYALVALELDTSPRVGQADGGLEAGKYLEVGITPQFGAARATIALPIKVGLSLDDYYELAGVDHQFGFLSLGTVATVPLIGVPRRFGAWNIHGGVEFQSLGDTPEAVNGGDQSKLIGSVGVGFSY